MEPNCLGDKRPEKNCFSWWGHIAAYGRKWYISGTGKDEASCDFEDPCKTIWHAVNVASRDDSIHLNGINTDKNPYTCQPGASAYPGIFIDKALSLIGYGNQLAWIQCSGGNSLTFNGTSASQRMRTKISNIGFKGGAMNFLDSSAHIENATFEDSTGVNLIIHNKMMSSLHIADSTFSKNKGCISVTSSTNQNVTFNLTLENVTLSQNEFSKNGLVFLDVKSGNHNIHFQNVAFKDNRRARPKVLHNNECIVQSLQAAVKIFIDSSYFRGGDARLFQISGSDISLFIHNSSFVGHNVSEGYGSGAVLSLSGSNHPQQSISLNVSNSSFVNTSADQCGAVNVQCVRACSNTFLNCIFIGNIAKRGSGGAVCISMVSKRYRSAYKVTHKTTTNTALNETSCVAVPDALHVTIQRCTFYKNKANLYNGGAASILAGSRTSIILQEVTVESNWARNFGGAISIYANENGNRDDIGSHYRNMVDSLDECNIIIALSNFSNNAAGNVGGAISLKGNKSVSLFLEKVSMESNTVGYSGGAVYVETIFSLMVQESLFSNNNASGQSAMGGAISIRQVKSDQKESILMIGNSIFSNNEAKGKGGACYIEANKKQAVLKLTNLTVVSNTAKLKGGAFSIKYFHAIQIHDSRFLNNTSLTTVGGAISLYDVDKLEVRECHFSNNHAGVTGFGGALHVESKTTSPSIEINSTTFYSCSAEQVGGAFYLRAHGNATLKVKGSRFARNHVVKYYGGAMAIYVGMSLVSPLLFEDTTFENNEASFGGVLHLSNGNATFQSCSFIDNIASTLGGHLHTAAGSSNLNILDSIFNQTVFKLHGSGNLTAGTFYVDTEGTLYITNTSLTATFPETNGPLVQVRNGRQVSLDNSTTLFCPNGSRMQIINFQGQINDQKVQTVQISCSSCEGNTYSMSRGVAYGLQLGPTLSCARCPFGANCTRSRNIFAEPNFWGFRGETDPSLLKFVTCPLGYCRPPSEADFPEYNSCQGNRTGKMCGRCKESYTETLYSPTCRPVEQCNDYWVWPLAFVYVSIVAFYFTFKPPVVTWTKRQILWFRGQTQQNQDENFDRGFMKIIFYFYQAANLVLVPESTQHILKTDFVATIIGLFNFKQTISPGKFPCPFPGLNVVTKRLLQASLVIGTMVMIPVFYTLHWGIKKIQRREAPSIGPYMGGFLQTLLLGYASLASVSFDLLHCVPVGSKTRLFFDGNIECYTSWQYIFMIVDSVFFVPFLFVLLWGSCKLYSGTVSVKHFLIACCFPLPSLIYWAISAMFCRDRHLAKLEEPPARQASKIFVERVLYEPFKPPEEGNKLSLSWEGFLIGRRLILIVLNVTIHDQMTRLCTISFVSVLFLLHHCKTQPYRDGIANKVETISLLCLVLLATINTFLASFPSFGITLDSTNPFTPSAKAFKIVKITILCFLPAIACFLLISALLSLVWRLVVVLYRTICRWVTGCYRNQDDAASPLLV
ncbi:uncharacterized protein LOC141881405 [Acropora palmata]|uniref:uncharacterized protein LOC141881405 n=1 Tax=Acropora palmata TaxID=6131 RepID=UPI003D9FBE8D